MTDSDREVDSRPRAILIVALLLGGFLRLHRLGEHGLLTDEFPTWWMSQAPSLSDLVQRVLGHAGMLPPFFLLERAMVLLLGPSALALRLAPALLGVAGIALLFGVVRQARFGEPAAAIAALLFATDRFAIRQAQEARPYSLAVALLLLATWLLLAYLESGRPVLGGLYLLAATAMIRVHGLFLPTLGFHLVVVIAAVTAGRRNWRDLFLGTAALGLGASVPAWQLVTLFQRRAELAWVSPANLEDWLLCVFRPHLALGLALGFAVALLLWRDRTEPSPPAPRRALLLVATWLLLPTLAALAVGRGFDVHLLVSRYLAPYTLAAYVLGGYFATRDRRTLVAMTFAVVVATSAGAMRNVKRGEAAYEFGHDGAKRAVELVTDPTRAVSAVLWQPWLIEANAIDRDDPDNRGYLCSPLTSFYAKGPAPATVIALRYSGAISEAEASRLELLLHAVDSSRSAPIALVTRSDAQPAYDRHLTSRLGLERQSVSTDLEGLVVGFYVPPANRPE